MTHSLDIRTYYEDTDAGGIVYHASYLRFAERGRTEMLRAAGFEHAQLFREQGVGFAVASLNISYKAPARLDELLTVKSRITRVGGASMDMAQDIWRGDDLICEIRVVLVCIDPALKAVRLPQAVRDLFTAQEA